MSQSRTQSIVEGLVNIAVGYTISIFAQLLIFPWFGINPPLIDNLLIGAAFTVVSLIRSYTIRRWFNKRVVRSTS